MIFRWSKIQGFSISNQAVPIQTPTMAGGLYAINRLYFDELCLEPADGKPTANRDIIFTICSDDRQEQNWEYDQQTLQLKSEFFSGKCLSVVGDSNVMLAQCDTSNPSQKWTFNQEVELFD
ncbi:unnamed protein product [Rotaria sp. Silwood1]|nr:unnamed protein product [Rotaria sp. Silwood1]